MVIERPAVGVNLESELGHTPRHAAETDEPVLVDTGDELFELDIHPVSRAQAPVRTPPSAAQVTRSIAGIRRAAGAWKGLVDVDDLTYELYARRRMANQPPVE